MAREEIGYLTFQVPERLLKKIDKLVEKGKFKDRKAVIKRALRETLADLGYIEVPRVWVTDDTEKGGEKIRMAVPYYYKYAIEKAIDHGKFRDYGHAVRDSIRHFLRRYVSCPFRLSRRRKKSKSKSK